MGIAGEIVDDGPLTSNPLYMASHDVLRQIVSSGANLILEESTSHDLLRELVQTALRTGSHITISANTSYDLIKELAAIGKGQVTFLVSKNS